MCTTESVVLGVTPKGRRTFSFSDESDIKEEAPFITSRNRGYSVYSESMVLLNLERSSPGISPRRRKSYSSDEASVTIRPSKYSSSRRDRRVLRKRSKSPSRTFSIIPQTHERDSCDSLGSASTLRCDSASEIYGPRRRKKSCFSDEESVKRHPSKSPPSRRDRRVPRTRSESPSRTPSIIPQTYERDGSVPSVSHSPTKVQKRSRRLPSTPKQSRSSRHNSPREYKTESPPSARPERYSERTSRRKCRSGVKKRDSRPVSPAYGQSSEDEPNSKYRDMSMVSGTFYYLKSGTPDHRLKEVNVDEKLLKMVSRFGSKECLGAVKHFSDMMFWSFMEKYLQLCPEKGQSGSIWQNDIEDLKILATLNSPALSRKKKNELRKAWKILLANTIINNAVVTYHYSKCSGNVNKRQKEEPCNCLGKPFLFGMTPHAYFSVDMIDNILNKTLEELIEEAFPNVYNIDTVTYSELAEKLKASVVRSSSSKKNAQASQWLETNFRASESIAASQKKDSSFGQFLLNYLHDPERKIFRSIAQSLSNAKKMDWCHPMLRMNRNTYARQSACDTRTQRRMNRHTREMAEANKKARELAALYKTPAFQAKLVAKTLSKLKYSEDMKSELTVESLKRYAEKLAVKAEEKKEARRQEVLQELYDECAKEKHRKNRKEKHKKKSKRRRKRKKYQKSYTSTETDEESPTFSEPSYEQKYPLSDERPEDRILQALKNNPYRQGWIVHQRVKRWSNYKDVPVWAKKLPSRERDLTIAQHNLSDLIYLLSSPSLKDQYSTKYEFLDENSNSIYGKYKQGSALIAKMEYDDITYYGTIFLGIGYDKKKRKDVLYHAQFVDYGHREISLHDISKNISKQLQECSQASDRVETRATDAGWKRKGTFTVKDGNVIVMDTKRAGSREREATFYIYPR